MKKVHRKLRGEGMTKLIDITGKVMSGEWGSDDEFGSGIPVLRTTNFTNEGVVNFDNVVTRTITKKNISEKYLRCGDIIIEKSGGSDNQPVGRVIYYDGPENTYLFNNFTGLLRVQNKNKWLPRYIFYSLFSNYRKGGTRKFENKTTGLHNLKTDDYVAKYEVTDAEYPMQVKVCNSLDKIAKIIEKRKQQLSALDDLIKARFVEMFGDPVKNTQNRPTTEFVNVVKMQRGFDLPVQDRQQNGTVPVFGSNGALDRHNAAKVQGGGVITGRSGTIGKVFYTEDDYWPLNTTLFSVDTHGNNVVYLAYLLEMFYLTILVEGTGVPTLNRNMFHNKQIIKVEKTEQKEFANFVTQIDKSKVAIQKALEKTQLLFDSLMQEYFG